MGKEVTYYGGAVNNQYLFLPFYGLTSCAVNIIRADNANAIGNIFASNITPKVWVYDSSIYMNDAPGRMYGFPSVDQTFYTNGVAWGLSTAFVPRESVSNRVCSIVTGASLSPSNLPVTRLQGKNYILTSANSVQDTAPAYISALDAANAGWAVEAWVFRTANAAQLVYVELNSNFTSFFAVGFNALGQLNIQCTTGATQITDTGSTIPLNAWTHVVWSFDGAGHFYGYINAANINPVAYTHGAAVVLPVLAYLNVTTGINALANLNCYGYWPSVSVWNRHYQEIAGGATQFSADYWSGAGLSQGGSMAQGNTYEVVYSNSGPVSFNSGAAFSSANLPLQGIGQIRFVNGVYQYEIHAEEMDVM